MASESERIRQLMDLLESTPVPIILNEGWLQNLKNKKIRKLGNKERQEMAGRLKAEWLKWLGQTGREGAMDDMQRFMKMRIGFEDNDIDSVLSTSMPQETADEGNAPQQDSEEDGTPVPTDLNRKLSDFGEVGIKVEPNDNKKEPNEIIDNPRKYQIANGDWDRKKISAKLDKMGMGDKLTLGSSTFSRSIGDAPANESIMEAEENEILGDEDVDAIFDSAAAYINDEYLLNGPRNDQASAAADAAAAGLGNRSRGRNGNGNYNDRGQMPSGQYDTKEMLAILQSELSVSKNKLQQITNHVKTTSSEGYTAMQRSDLDLLSRIGYALLRART